MLAADESHWWYRGRRRVLRAELARLPLPRYARILDAGCGSGRTLDLLADHGSVAGLDASPQAAALARDRGHDEVHAGRLEVLPWEDGAFDLVTCLDVVEHTPDDRAALRELRRVTRPGGWALLTVPAYPVLWSAHDVVNEHERRYTRRGLRAAAYQAGWRVERETGFNALLLPAVAAVRLAERARGGVNGHGRSDLALTPSRLNGLLELPLRAEAAWLRRGRSLPVGLSLLAVLARPL